MPRSEPRSNSAGIISRTRSPPALRTATCSALNYLELARLGREDFLEMVRQFPSCGAASSSNHSVFSAILMSIHW